MEGLQQCNELSGKHFNTGPPDTKQQGCRVDRDVSSFRSVSYLKKGGDFL